MRSGSLARGGTSYGDPRVADLPLGADQTLRGRRFRLDERARDLARRQAAEGPQRQRLLRLGRQRGMAAHEEQPQPVVVDA